MYTMKLLPVIMIYLCAAMPCQAGDSTTFAFGRSGQTLGNNRTFSVAIADVDLHGDLALLTTHQANGKQRWLNNGSAVFTSAGPVLGRARVAALACGRLDRDVEFDVVLGMAENTGGNQIYFNESVDSCCSTVTDVDGNVYGTVTIGAQVWMAENLKVTHYRNGEPLANVVDSANWLNQTCGAYCNYANDVVNVDAYGRLYNWYATSDNRSIAPAGWHVPSDIEWQALVDFLGGDAVAGWKIKESGTAHWLPPNIGATNEYGFTALPGGYRGWYGLFADLGNYATFWTATVSSSTHAWYRSLSYDNPDVNHYDSKKHYGFSVRCVKDVGCCIGRVGDANGSGEDEPTVGDVSVLIDAKFITGTCDGILLCLPEADINQSGGANPICDDLTIGDISVLIDYLFITGSSLGLPNCL